MKKPIALTIEECRKILSDFSKEAGQYEPPEYDWFSCWFEGFPEPNPDCNERLREMIHASAEAEGEDESTIEGLTRILQIMYFG